MFKLLIWRYAVSKGNVSLSFLLLSLAKFPKWLILLTTYKCLICIFKIILYFKLAAERVYWVGISSSLNFFWIFSENSIPKVTFLGQYAKKYAKHFKKTKKKVVITNFFRMDGNQWSFSSLAFYCLQIPWPHKGRKKSLYRKQMDNTD